MQQQRLQELFDELSGPLVLYARGWCDAPDDAVQEAFIDLSRCSVEPDSPEAWLHKTTRRKAQNIARAEGRRQKHHQRACQEQVAWFDECRSSNDLAPTDVVRGLELLSTEERELVVARVWGQLGFEQLAELLDCSISSAHRRYTAALSQLKTLVLSESLEQQPLQPLIDKPPRRRVDGVES